MSQQLSLPHLLSCVTDKERYKGTQLYILQVLRLNQQIYPIIDASITQTLLKPKTTPMSRLLTLRFFKEILMTANFSLIDGLNEKIEEHLIEVAQYNKKSKEVNRGANYFSDTFKVKNDAQIQKISSSYVLLTLETLTVMAKWYTKDEDGEQSRFVQYYRELQENGVVFPQGKELNFFKKEDQAKFKKNYAKWHQNYLKYNEAEKEKQEVVQSKIEESKVAIVKQQLVINQLQKSRQKPSQQQRMKLELCQLKKQAEQKDKEIKALQQKWMNQQKVSIGLEQSNKEQLQTIMKLQQQLKSAKQAIQKQPAKAEQNYQLIIHPPNNTEQLQNQIENLQQELKNTKYTLNSNSLELQSSLNHLQTENTKLKQSLQANQRQKSQIIQNLQNQNSLLLQQKQSLQQKLANKVEASFVVIDQPRVGSIEKQQKQMITLKEQILSSKHQILRDETKLRDRLNLICKDEIVETGHKRQVSRSLKKTESQHRLTMNQTSTNTSAFKRTNNENKLAKTAQSFKHRVQGSKMVTVFPFINNYFPLLPKQSLNFKQHCLNLIDSKSPFFQNQWIKVTLLKINSTKCFIQVYNKASNDQKIKIMSAHPSFSLQGEKIKKVASCTAAEYQLTIGRLDLNMRCPLISIILGNHGISLTTTPVNEKIFHLPLPFTLLDLLTIQKPKKTKLGQKTIRFGVNRFNLGSRLPSIQNCLPNLCCQFQNGETVRKGQIEWEGELLRLQVVCWSRQVSLSVQFSDSHEEIMSLGKVLLQVIMYLLQD